MALYKQIKSSQFTIGIGIFLAIAVIISAVTTAMVLRNQEIELWRKQLSNHTLTLSEQTFQMMSASYNALASIADRVNEEGANTPDAFRNKMGTLAIHQMLKEKIELLPQVDVATVVAINGDVINFTRSYPAPRINLSDRDYFREHAGGAAGADKFISVSVRNKGNGKWVFYISRRINDSHGSMLGLVLVGISVESFTRFYEKLGVNLGQGASVSLYRTDFTMLARWPLKTELIGRVNKSGTAYIVMEKEKKDNDVIYIDGPRFSENDKKVARLGAVRLVKDYPLILNIAVTEEYFLANWRNYLKWIVALSLSSVILLLSGLAFIAGVQRRRDSERKQAVADLRESEKKHRMLFENAGDAIAINNFSGKILAVNRRTCEQLGYSQAELLNMTIDAVDTPENNLAAKERMARLEEQGSVTFETEHLRKDGTTIPIEINARIVTWDGEPAVMSISRNLTERQQIEEERRSMELQIQQAQKLESLGVLAGGIAHDFNNILMAILGNAELALLKVNPESPAVDNLKRIELSTARAADLAKQMLAYSGKGKFVVEHLDMSRLVEEMLHMIEVSISKKAVLRLNLTHPIPAVEADATQLRQIIMNLVVNASEAIGDTSGVIAITTGCMEYDRNYLKSVWLSENLHAGLYVSLEVSDTGCGMDSETLAKLFDPFFTTKFTGRGLGMAAVLGIVRGHKGAIRVYSEPGKGSCFKIMLPASSGLSVVSESPGTSDGWKGAGTVLLVDDEETVRAIGSDMLRELGFTVVTAEDGRDALEVFTSRNDIDFVILDLTMPHLDGEQCFRELRKLNPELKVIMSSGFNQQEVTQKFVGKGLAGFIQKPYRLSLLKEETRRIMTGVNET